MTAGVAAVRSYIRSRRRRQWFDLYAIGFAAVVGLLYLADALHVPLSRLTASASAPVPAQTMAGTALVAGAAAALLMLAQAFGPLVLSPADASWLLLTPLDRRGVLRRPALVTAVLASLAGAVLGVLALAMAWPYLRGGGQHLSATWILLAAVGGAGLFLAATLAAVLAQPRQPYRARLRATWAVVAAIAVVAGVAGERVRALSRVVTDGFTDISKGTFGVLAVVAVVAACVFVLLLWRLLPRFPAGVLWSQSAQTGTALTAISFGNLSLLSWIAEDNYWRSRVLTSRPFPRLAPAFARSSPRLSPAFALAWADWRRLARRPVSLTVLAGSTLAPALAGAAITGHARGYTLAVVLLAGAIAAGTQGTAATRRDTSDPVLRRLLGVEAAPALGARAVLPALLSAVWLAVALALLVIVGVLPGLAWPLLGLLAGPAVTPAVLRIARTGVIEPGDEGLVLPVGNVPMWLITRAISLVLGVAGCFPALKAVAAGHVHASTLVAQLAFSVILIPVYIQLAAQPRR
jgi:Family of unknown function (DUF6297)